MSIQDDENREIEGIVSGPSGEMDRRRFLKLAGFGAAGLAIGGAFAGTFAPEALATSATGPAGTPDTPIHPPKQLIDAYSHIMPQPFYDFVKSKLPPAPLRPALAAYTVMLNAASMAPEGRIDVMDKQGVTMCILIPSPLEAIAPVWNNPVNAPAVATAFNDELANNWVKIYPDRFKFCALLPTGQPGAMVVELETAVGKGAVGGFIACGPASRPLG